MALKFFNVVKANAHIEAQDAQIATLTAQLAEASANPVALESELTQSQADLVTARASLASLTEAAKAHDAQVTQLTTDLSAARASLALLPEKIEEAAAAKAVVISASQGVPPLAISPVNPQTTEPAKPALKGFAAVQAAFAAQLLAAAA